MEAYVEKRRDALAAELRAQREDRGVKLREIGAYAQMDPSQVHRYLSGKRDIPFPTLCALSGAVGVSLVDLVQRVQERIDKA